MTAGPAFSDADHDRVIADAHRVPHRARLAVRGGSPGKQPLFLQAKAAIRSERARADVLAQTGENVVDFCLYGPPARGNTREVWKIDDSG